MFVNMYKKQLLYFSLCMFNILCTENNFVNASSLSHIKFDCFEGVRDDNNVKRHKDASEEAKSYLLNEYDIQFYHELSRIDVSNDIGKDELWRKISQFIKFKIDNCDDEDVFIQEKLKTRYNEETDEKIQKYERSYFEYDDAIVESIIKDIKSTFDIKPALEMWKLIACKLNSRLHFVNTVEKYLNDDNKTKFAIFLNTYDFNRCELESQFVDINEDKIMQFMSKLVDYSVIVDIDSLYQQQQDNIKVDQYKNDNFIIDQFINTVIKMISDITRTCKIYILKLTCDMVDSILDVGDIKLNTIFLSNNTINLYYLYNLHKNTSVDLAYHKKLQSKRPIVLLHEATHVHHDMIVDFRNKTQIELVYKMFY